jgi:putative acyl-CoA dehydrogenase
VRTIIEMVAMTRFDCMIGSSAGHAHGVRRRCTTAAALGLRQACSTEQPLMQNVLADLALESEARWR